MSQQTPEVDSPTPAKSSLLESVEKRLYNSKAPISKLSDDVLSYTFMLNAQLDYQHSHIPSITTRRSSQVIKKWRDVALNHPMLWATSLDFADPLQWIQEVINRAAASPVTLTFPPLAYNNIGDKIVPHFRPASFSLFKRADGSNEKFNLALSLCSRARHIALQITDKDADSPRWKHALQNLTKASPHLETFTLFSSPAFLNGQMYTLPENLFDGQAARLRSLNLVNSRCHFTSPAFCRLSSLYVTSFHPGHPAAEWLKIIAGMPELVELALENSFLEDKIPWVEVKSPSIADLRSVVVMSKLQKLILKGIYTACSVIFTHLEFPPSCGMHVFCFNTEDDEDYRTMMNFVQRRLAAFSVSHWKERGVSIQYNSTEFAFSNIHQSPERNNFSFHWYLSMGPMGDVSSSFFSTLHTAFSDITDLHLDLEPYKESDTTQVLRVFEKVQNLRISHHYVNVLHCLLEPQKASEGTHTNLLPSLNKISFYNLTFGKESRMLSMDDIINLVYERSNVGTLIEVIKFTGCGGIVGYISELEILGVEVEWDGKDHIIDRETVPVTQE